MSPTSAAPQTATASSVRAAGVLIVDDHPVVRQGLKLLIDAEPDLSVCGEAAGIDDALEQYRRCRPELVTVDISLKDGSGIELVKELRALDPHARILVSSMHDETLFAERSLRAGAMGYLNKETAPQEIVEAVRQVLEGRIYLSKPMSERLLSRAVGGEKPSLRSPVEKLSDRELEVFELIGRGTATREIAERLDLSVKTVETYRENIKQKLQLNNAAELTRHAVQWVLEQG